MIDLRDVVTIIVVLVLLWKGPRIRFSGGSGYRGYYENNGPN